MVREIGGGIASWCADSSQMALGNTVWSDWKNAAQPHLKLPVPATRGTRSREAALAWSPDGKRIALGAIEAIHVYDAQSGRVLD
jgi:hypothetical protein